MPTAHLQTSTPEQVEWITKEEAARLLDKSERTILTMVQRGEIKSKRERDPEKRGQKVTLLHAGDVARLAEGAEQSLSVQVARKPAADLQSSDVFTAARLLAGVPDPVQRPWLTLDQAAKYSGLTKRWLLQEAQREPKVYETDIAVRDMGKHAPGGRWRFHRESLAKP